MADGMDREPMQDEERLPPVTPERRAEPRANLRKRFPEVTDEDLDEVSQEETTKDKVEKFIYKLIQKYKWSRSVCQQQLGMGLDDVRDC